MLNPLKFLSKIIKSSNQKELDRLNKITKKINDLEDQVKKLGDQTFPQKTKDLIVEKSSYINELLENVRRRSIPIEYYFSDKDFKGKKIVF